MSIVSRGVVQSQFLTRVWLLWLYPHCVSLPFRYNHAAMDTDKQNWAWRHHAAALILYTILTLYVTWPLVNHLSTALAGSSTDALLHYWNGWWVRQSLRDSQSVYYTTYLFYPHGASLVYHNIAWLNIAPWLVLQNFLDGILAYNLVILANFVLCGYACFLLVKHLTQKFGAAFLAGLVYLAWPYRLSQIDHPNLISTQWLPLFFLFLLLTLRDKRILYAVLAGISLALVGYTRWQLLIPGGITVLIYLLAVLPQWVKKRQKWFLLLGMGLVALIILGPPLSLLVQQQQTTQDTPETLLRESEEAIMQTDVLAYVTPPNSHPTLQTWTAPLYDHYYADRTDFRRFPTYLGMMVLLLLLIGVWYDPRRTFPWLLMVIVLILFALGPLLRLNGQLYDLPYLPYRLLQSTFILRLIREPERFNIILALPVAVLAGYGMVAIHILMKEMKKLSQVAVLGLIGGIILFEYAYGPVPLQSTQLPVYYEELAQEEGDFAVLTLPIDANKAKVQMFAQTTHGRYLLHGHISRPPTGVYGTIDNHPWLRVLRQSEEMPPWLPDVSQQMASLAQEGIRYIIFYKNQVGADRIEHWRRYLAFQPVYEDEAIAVFATQPQVNRDYTLQTELQPGFGPVQTLITGDCFQPGQAMEVDVAWGTATMPEDDYQVHLALVSPNGAVAQEEVFPVLTEWPTQQWPANALVWGYYPLALKADLPVGEYDLMVFLGEAGDEFRLAQAWPLSSLTVDTKPCLFPVPETSSPIGARFGEQMHLLAYEINEQNANSLVITLDWRAEQQMGTDYTVFVHLADPNSGVPVAQNDAMPNQGGYPTRFWATGEILADRIQLDLTGTAAGTYHLAIGVYDPLTGERLPLVTQDGQQPEDRRLVIVGENIVR
ncbi:MAG: hypothetical protein IPL78_03950 [Chloroflexi bacterium]|nr:hypothetical protein [Chloroflexota bacterium]